MRAGRAFTSVFARLPKARVRTDGGEGQSPVSCMHRFVIIKTARLKIGVKKIARKMPMASNVEFESSNTDHPPVVSKAEWLARPRRNKREASPTPMGKDRRVIFL